MEMFGMILFIPLFFFFSIFLAFTIRKRRIEKIIFIENDENLKDLRAWDFFYNILRMEKSAKPIYYTEFFLLILDTIYILFGGYKEYLKEIEFVKEFPDFPMSPVSSVLIKFAIPIILWFVILLLLLFALIMKKKENKRISEMLDNLEKAKFLKFAKEDFLKSDRIVGTGIVIQSDIKLGDKFLFSIYPAYIIPYSWIDNVKIDEIRGRGGRRLYLDFTLKKSYESIKIFFAKEDVAEKIKDFSLKTKNKNNRDKI
ncbi:hypothetical protein RO03_04700 [Fusobacterium nucleatum subsp. nucleatum]|uniref:Uncharacterized protein n=1 Tax=Fusobacterium nucleatum subsp. nucleatum TaxID=76856 RepID=A0A0M5MBS0_FUSNC|nr:hypothetical protein [Fusobacterium nucleatum]ALF24453.1 hypothetical protein RO05_08760 [Fusobacterium nucleatum subsp. nucleatum ChDC F316]ALF25514.1 hypothetical protein RN95_03320 [Fusobacterium nucleatum subsp. nucleatum]ASG26280.1 hypothetical protein RN84_05110 [Fusobacterium nucleatum subsp. nucleatum]KUL98836.1 hypothetical protein RO03_04700 [Fusobacterium nucleatum subsp. nucleatum]MCG6843711.1 hypothetical protein [Fusobacterium nucleatum]